MQEPRQRHLEAAIQMLQYHRSCPGQGIVLLADNTLDSLCIVILIGMVVLRYRSVTSYLGKLRQAPVSWKAKKQATLSRSSVEVKY